MRRKRAGGRQLAARLRKALAKRRWNEADARTVIEWVRAQCGTDGATILGNRARDAGGPRSGSLLTPALETGAAEHGAQLAQHDALDLAGALTGDAEVLADLLQGQTFLAH